MKHFLCHRRGLRDVTIGFFGGIGGCDGAAPLALAAAGSGLRMACSRFRRFSLRLGCSWLRLPPLAALGSLLLASASLLPVLASAARGFDFVASRFGLAARVSTSPLAALGSPLLASAWLLVVSTSLLMASAATDCRAEFVACRSDLPARASASAACRAEFAASGFGLAAHGFGFRRLPH